MEEGWDDEVAVLFAEADNAGPGLEDAEGLAVGAEHPFGAAGGARGEEDVGEVAAREAVVALLEHRRAAASGTAAEGGPRLHAAGGGCVVEGDDAAQVGELGGGQHGGVVGAKETGGNEGVRGAGGVGDVGGLGLLEAGVEWDDRAACELNAERCDHPFVPVLGPDEGPVAVAEAVCDECGGDFDGGGPEVGAGEDEVALDKEGGVGCSGGEACEQVGDDGGRRGRGEVAVHGRARGGSQDRCSLAGGLKHVLAYEQRWCHPNRQGIRCTLA